MNGGDDPVAAWRAWSAADVRTRGHEALVLGAVAGVPRSTWLLPGRRERGVAILRGCPADRLGASRPWRVLPPGSSPAGRAAVGLGLALAGEKALVFLGTGSAAYGEFHGALHGIKAMGAEGLCLLLSWYEGEGPFGPQLGMAPSALASALGLPAVQVDGRDEAAVRAAVSRFPALVEARFSPR